MSEKRKHKSSPRSSSSKFKLKIQNSSKAEEDTINNGETTPNRHSTPIRKANINNVEDSPEMDYRCSPIMGPCTQQSEVGWSWQSSKEETNSNYENKTPKRSAQLQKRRISDSPLMYVPLKVKLKKQERDVDTFIANFEPFNNKIDVKEVEVAVPSTSENYQSDVHNRLNLEKNLETSDEGDMRLVYRDDETAMETASEKQIGTNFKDLFDDEIDESMVRCSQLVEEEFFAQNDQYQEKKNASSVLPSDKEKESSTNENQISIKGLHKLIKVPLEKPKEVAEVTAKPASLQEKVTTIPDDSFDECLSQFADDDFSLALRNIEIPESKHQSLHIRPNNLAQKKSLFSSNNNNTSIKVGSTRSSSFMEAKRPVTVSGSDRLFSKTKSFDSQREICRNSGKNVAKELVQNTENKPESLVSPRKFFKTKSLSEPFSKDPKTSCVLNKNKAPEMNTCNSSTQNVRKVIGKSFRCKIYSDSSLNRSLRTTDNKVNGSSQDSFISLGNNFDNVQLSNSNRSMERLQDQRTNDTQETMCTPAEIERKRIEAKMKLEAKRRMILSSKANSMTTNLPIVQSVKR